MRLALDRRDPQLIASKSKKHPARDQKQIIRARIEAELEE